MYKYILSVRFLGTPATYYPALYLFTFSGVYCSLVYSTSKYVFLTTKMAQIRLFFWGPKTWSESILWQRFCFGMVSTTSLSLSMRGRYKNEITEWKWPPIFQNKSVEYARADKLGLYSSTTLQVKRGHQPMSRFYFSCSRIVGG